MKEKLQEIFREIEKQSGYQIIDTVCIWKCIRQEMLNWFQTGKSIDLGEGFGEFQTSLFVPTLLLHPLGHGSGHKCFLLHVFLGYSSIPPAPGLI